MSKEMEKAVKTLNGLGYKVIIEKRLRKGWECRIKSHLKTWSALGGTIEEAFEAADRKRVLG